jgi:hypothetical protein
MSGRPPSIEVASNSNPSHLFSFRNDPQYRSDNGLEYDSYWGLKTPRLPEFQPERSEREDILCSGRRTYSGGMELSEYSLPPPPEVFVVLICHPRSTMLVL